MTRNQKLGVGLGVIATGALIGSVVFAQPNLPLTLIWTTDCPGLSLALAEVHVSADIVQCWLIDMTATPTNTPRPRPTFTPRPTLTPRAPPTLTPRPSPGPPD